MIYAYNHSIYVLPFSRNDIEFILKHYPLEKQTAKAGEELAELIQVINKYLAGCIHFAAFKEKLTEEMADSIIMMNQLVQGYGIDDEELNAAIHRKMERQINRIIDEEKQGTIRLTDKDFAPMKELEELRLRLERIKNE